MIELAWTTIIVWVIVGALAGTAAGAVLRRGSGKFGMVLNILIGLVGALIGGFIFDVFDIRIGALDQIQIDLQQLLSAFIGALLFVLILRGLKRS